MNRALICLTFGWAAFLAAAIAAQQPKQIKDPTEYSAYMTAFSTQDPAAKAAAMDAFVAQYPNSVVKIDALEQAMAAYQQAQIQAVASQQAQIQAKVIEKARQILALEANNMRALAIVTAIDRAKATEGDTAALKEGCGYAQTGLQQLPSWKSEGMPEADFAKLRTALAQVFNGAAGFCALQNKDYTGARANYLKAIQNDPNNLQDTYQLAIAYLETDPVDLRGFWYGAKSLSLAGNNAATVNAIAPYIKGKYKKYHGKVDDWDRFAATAASQTAPPAMDELAKLISPAPTPCDFAVQAVRDNPIDDLSFNDKEFILSKANCSPANKDAADKVWQSILTLEKNGEARLQIPVKIISATTDTIEAAVSDDNQEANKADMHVALEKPVVKPPAPGTMTKVVGVITKYTPDPFLFTMEKGELQAPPKPPAKQPPARRPGAAKKK
jgi:tetratricopeptide (TPR) repeat protein